MSENLLFPLTVAGQFIKAIDTEQGNDGRLSEYVYSDWLDEIGDPRGEAWRVLIEQGIMPRSARSSRSIQTHWTWYRFKNWFVPVHAHINWLFLELPRMDTDRRVLVWTSKSFFDAMDAAATAWVRVERDPLFLRFHHNKVS